MDTTTTTQTILDALYEIGQPCRRSELAGVADLTIKKIAGPLEELVACGLVARLEDGRYTLGAVYAEPRRRAS